MRGIVALGLLLVSATAYAYVGPGLGLGVLGAIFGLLAAVFLAIVGVVWYPMKRFMAKHKRGASSADPSKRDQSAVRPAPSREKLQKSQT